MTEQTTQSLELELPDSFHRVKRTLLLLSSALIVLGTTQPDIIDAASLLQPSLVHAAKPSLVTLRALLLIAASYYAWGFAHEIRAAHRRNGDLIVGKELPGYERQIRAFIAMLTDHATQLEQISKSAEPSLRRYFAEVERAARAYADSPMPKIEHRLSQLREAEEKRLKDNPAAVIDPSAQEKQIRHGIVDIIRGANNHISNAQSGASSLLNSISRLAGKTEVLIQVAERASDRVRMNRLIYRDRAISFFGWEAGGGFAAYAVALTFTVSPLGFVLADALTDVVKRLS